MTALQTKTITTSAYQATDEERQAIRAITRAIRSADKRLRKCYPVLNYQNALGTVFFLTAVGVFLGSAVLYVQGVMPWWLCIPVIAIASSVLRELEHDLVHDLYFKKRRRLQNLMMAAVWPFLGNMVSPWYRREIHLLHHRASGNEDDLEEQLIGNGMKYGPLRILAMCDTGLSMLFRRKQVEAIPAFNYRQFVLACTPVLMIFYGVWISFLAYHAAEFVAWIGGTTLPTANWITSYIAVIDTLAVVYVLPNIVQKISVQVLSSNMHYFGDVHSRLQELQVLNGWYFFPLQLFSWNFGSTHAIHHFVANQPFYLRQMVARDAHAVMRGNGIRFNDLATVLRANRYCDTDHQLADG